jgi:prolyl-tRNA editing enzyme YbaK/EbsC (Cys-tRNA(Pro) deacylase)
VEVLRGAGITAEVTEFAESARTAEEAARAVGASVGQIVKSLVFLVGEQPILALVSGANRADVAKLVALTGAPIRQADAASVRAATGFAIGGVPPVGHASALPSYLDADLCQYPRVWAAAGTPNAVFSITPADLERITRARVVDLAARVES